MWCFKKFLESRAYSTKKYCTTNALHGTEDDILWDNANINDSEVSDSEESETDFNVFKSNDGTCESE